MDAFIGRKVPEAVVGALALLLLLLVKSGCGYRFTAGDALGGDPEIKRVFVPVFEDDGVEADAAWIFTAALRRELQMSGIQLVGREDADAVVKGKLRRVATRPTLQPVAGNVRVGEHRLSVVIDLELRRSADDSLIYAKQGLSADRPYLAGFDAAAAEAGRVRSLERVAAELMRDARWELFVGPGARPPQADEPAPAQPVPGDVSSGR